VFRFSFMGDSSVLSVTTVFGGHDHDERSSGERVKAPSRS